MKVTVVKRKICNQLLQQVGEFPPLPAIVSKILMVTSDPESSIDDLKVLVEAEISLASSLLKLANSPFFGLCRKVSSIPHALTVLGLEEVTNLVLAKAMFNTFKGFRNKGDMINGLWKHSFHCGLAASVIAKRIGHYSSDFFVAGIIHDIGRMVIYLALNKENLEKLYSEVRPLQGGLVETLRLGVDHQHLGAELVRSWMFPESLQFGVGYHHKPEESPAHLEVPLVLCLSDAVVRYLELERGSDLALQVKADFMSTPASTMFLSYGVDLKSDTFEHILDDVEEVLADADSLALLLAG